MFCLMKFKKFPEAIGNENPFFLSLNGFFRGSFDAYSDKLPL